MCAKRNREKYIDRIIVCKQKQATNKNIANGFGKRNKEKTKEKKKKPRKRTKKRAIENTAKFRGMCSESKRFFS